LWVPGIPGISIVFR